MTGAALEPSWPAVVLNTHYSGLAAARQLARHGVAVYGLTSFAEFPGNVSRYLTYVPSADSLSAPQALLKQLLSLADRIGTPVLLPTRDHDVNFINRYRQDLDRSFLIAQPTRECLEQVMNKEILAELASRAGIFVPRSLTIRSHDEIATARDLMYPCICKPLYASQWRRPEMWERVGRQKALKVDSYAALEQFHAGFASIDPLVTVQEWIEGGEEALQIYGAACDTDGEVLASFTARKRLQYPPLAGTGIVVEALPLPDLDEPSRRLLGALRFRGICEIEFKKSANDGRLYLIEINPRHWDQHGLGYAVGVDLTEAVYRNLTGQPARWMQQSEEHVMWVAEAEFIRHVARCATGRSPWKDMLLPIGSRRTWSIFSRDDPWPFLKRLGLSRRAQTGLKSS